jgi:hypothetical protein
MDQIPLPGDVIACISQAPTVINVSADVTGATNNNVHATYVLAADGTGGTLGLSSVSGATFTWQLGPIVWSQSHGLGGAITITVTASNAGGKTSNSATITLASCQDSHPNNPPTVRVTATPTVLLAVACGFGGAVATVTIVVPDSDDPVDQDTVAATYVMNGQQVAFPVTFNGQAFVGQFGNFSLPRQDTQITISATATDPRGAVSKPGSTMISLASTCPVG